MSDVIENYVCYVIFEKNEVGVLPRWASCPTLPYINILRHSTTTGFLEMGLGGILIGTFIHWNNFVTKWRHWVTINL